MNFNKARKEELYHNFGQAVSDGDIHEVKRFISNGIDVNHSVPFINSSGEEESNPAIFNAIFNDDKAMVKMLLTAGANKKSLWTFMDEHDFAREDILRSDKFTIVGVGLLRIVEANDSSEQERALNMLKVLLENGADPETTEILRFKDEDVLKDPSLHFLIDRMVIAKENNETFDYSYYFDVLDLLIKYGADVNGVVKSQGTRTPILFFAIDSEDERIVEKLLSVGASWDAKLTTSDFSTYRLRKIPFNKRISNVDFLKFLQKTGWKGEGFSGWKE